MNEEYVSRQEVYEALTYEMAGTGYQGTALMALRLCDNKEVEPVRYGHWILNDRLIKSPWARNCHCSECGFEPMEQGNFCPNCGAKMRKEDM